MSASTEKKTRKAAREAGTDKKLIAQQKAESEKAKSQRKWIIGGVLVVLLIALTFFLNSGFLYRNTTAISINGKSHAPAELSYYYGTEYSTYQNYASYYGIDVSAMVDADTLTENAIENVKQVQALCDYAAAEGITLDQSEIDEIDEQLEELRTNVIAGGYKDLNVYFSYNFGNGVTEKFARELMLRQSLASKAYSHKQDSLVYSDEELEEYYTGLNGESDCFTYDYYFVYAETVEGEPDEEGNTTSAATDETMAEAKALAEEIKAAYAESEGEDYSARFSEAVATVAGSTSSNSKNLAGSSLNDSFKEWMMDSSRKAGDVTVAENEAAGGYYALVFLSRNDNHYNTATMRHILVNAEADENGEYSDEALAAAHSAAEEIYKEWKAGEATEDSFAALANERSEDSGSNTNGGLYEDIYQGQMVSAIDEYIFGGRKAGDTELMDVVSTNYAGTHIVYYVGEGGLYSNVIAKNALSSDALTEWSEALFADYTVKNGWTYNLITKK